MLGIDLNDVSQAERAISVVNDVVSGKEEGDGVGIIRYFSCAFNLLMLNISFIQGRGAIKTFMNLFITEEVFMM